MTIREQIDDAALQILEQEPKGLTFTELWQKVQTATGAKEGTVKSTLPSLVTRRPGLVLKPARGLFLHTKYSDVESSNKTTDIAATADAVREEHFYQPFADWLVNELEECTKAVPVGGNRFRDKWGTPDVIGIRKSKPSDIVKFDTEIVSVEIKLDADGLITAFGQSCAYRIFSHKSYIVVPEASSVNDLARIDTLCRLFGIGLILFNSSNPSAPHFQIRVRSGRHEPDMFYVNQKMKLMEHELFD